MSEALLWAELKDRKLGGFKFVRQMPIGPYFADFACRQHKLVVECDGSQHADSEHDRRRDLYIRNNGSAVARFWNTDVVTRIDEVCETILAILHGRISEPVLSADFNFKPPIPKSPSPAALRPPLPRGERNALSGKV